MPIMKKGRENFVLVLILLLVGAFFFMFFRIVDTQNLVPVFPVMGFAVESDEVVDCGTDIDCFIENSKTCNPSKVLWTNTFNYFGMVSTEKTYMEIKGLESDKCAYYNKLQEATIDNSDEIVQSGFYTQEELEQQKKISLNLSHRTCKFDQQNLTAMINKWKKGDKSLNDFDIAECTVHGYNLQDAEAQSSEQDTPSGINTETTSSDAGSSDAGGADEAALSAGSDAAGTDALAGDNGAEQETAEPVIKKIDEEQQKKTPAIQMPSLLGSTDSIAYIAAIGFFVIVIAIIAAVFLIRPKKNKQGTTAGTISAQNQMQMQQQMPQMSMQSQQPQQIDPQIASYVYQMKQSGYNSMQIRQQLASSGWQQPQIDDLFRRMGIF